MAVMVGMTGSVTHTVGALDTAEAVGSGLVDVLATPRVVAWCEEATLVAVMPGIRDSDVCVGTRVSLEHLVALGVGATVIASATVVSTDGRIITLDVEARTPADAGDELVAHGEVVRVVLDRTRFLERVAATPPVA